MTIPPTTSWKARLLAVPVLGKILRWVNNHLRLNARLFAINQQLAELQSARAAFEAQIQVVRAEQQAHKEWLEMIGLDERLRKLDQANVINRLNRLDALDIANRLHVFDCINIANRLNQYDSQELDARLKRQEELARERDNRVASLIQALSSAPAVAATPAAPTAVNTKPAAAPALSGMDRFYLEFEDRFRGAPEDIRTRLSVYLSYLQNLAGDANASVVDIGCGRGEWLGLLKEQGITARGIDLNAAMVDTCRARGLQADCADAVDWLRSQPPGSIAAVTAFHLIEHLPFETLIALFDAALQALRPDGMLIFESPNPENIVVAAHHFYYDPTHRNPVVPVVVEFMARQRGFARAEILRLNPYPDSYLLPEDSELARRFNRAFYGPQDFALLAWRAHAA